MYERRSRASFPSLRPSGRSALLTRALLTRALLTRALLTRALLTRALLTRALLTRALLTRALLTSALLARISLRARATSSDDSDEGSRAGAQPMTATIVI